MDFLCTGASLRSNNRRTLRVTVTGTWAYSEALPRLLDFSDGERAMVHIGSVSVLSSPACTMRFSRMQRWRGANTLLDRVAGDRGVFVL